ncbi:helix-turn-helix transcriptional regulator [Lacticaseibacillus saniviri]
MERENLKELRKRAGLTQTELADELGISTIYLRKIEKGARQPSNNVAANFVEYFGVSANELFPDIYQVLIDTKSINERSKQ